MGNNNKTWYEKVGIWIAIVAGICTIFGVSIFGDKSIFRDNQTDAISINSENNKMDDQTSVIIGDGNIINYESTNSENIANIQSNDYEDEKTSSQYHRGIIYTASWESEFIGLRYIVPDGMSMLAKEELEEKMNGIEEESPSIISSQNELGDAELAFVYEMVSIANDKRAVVGVCVYRMIDEMDVFRYIEVLELQMDQNPFADLTLISDDETIKIGNEVYIKVSYTIESNNDFLYTDNYVRIIGDRAIEIILFFDDEKVKDNILNAFTAY